MNRSNSRSKWKDVLGFDDGSIPNAATTYRYTPFSSTSSDLLIPAQDSYPDFPRAMSIAHHPDYSRRDLLIRPFLPMPKYGPEDKERGKWLPKTVPLFYVTVSEEPLPTSASRRPRDFDDDGNIQTSRPELLLHEGGRSKNRVLAMAKFHSVTMCTDVTLCPKTNHPNRSVRGLSRAGSVGTRPLTSPSESGFEKPKLVLGKDDSGRPRLRVVRVWLRGDNGFLRRGRWNFEISREMRRESYEWKRDRSGEKSGIGAWCNLDVAWSYEANGQCERLKLVNSRTREIVAGFVRRDEDEECLGTFRFFGDEIGGEFNVLAVMSLLNIIERGRRKAGPGGSNRLSKAFRNE